MPIFAPIIDKISEKEDEYLSKSSIFISNKKSMKDLSVYNNNKNLSSQDKLH